MLSRLTFLSLIFIFSLNSNAYYRNLVCNYSYKLSDQSYFKVMQKEAYLQGAEIYKWAELNRNDGFSDDNSEISVHFSVPYRYFEINYQNLISGETQGYVDNIEIGNLLILEVPLKKQIWNEKEIIAFLLKCKFIVDGEWDGN